MYFSICDDDFAPHGTIKIIGKLLDELHGTIFSWLSHLKCKAPSSMWPPAQGSVDFWSSSFHDRSLGFNVGTYIHRIKGSLCYSAGTSLHGT